MSKDKQSAMKGKAKKIVSDDDKLDDALDDSFPASDPPSQTDPLKHLGSGKKAGPGNSQKPM